MAEDRATSAHTLEQQKTVKLFAIEKHAYDQAGHHKAYVLRRCVGLSAAPLGACASPSCFERETSKPSRSASWALSRRT
eukprot:6203237-Pleurochrysis_carterae.AAC.1